MTPNIFFVTLCRSPDLTLGSDDEDIFADSPRKPKTTESTGFKSRLK